MQVRTVFDLSISHGYLQFRRLSLHLTFLLEPTMIWKTCLACFIFATFTGILHAEDKSKNLLKPTNKPESWQFEQHESAKGSITAEDDAIVFKVTTSDGTDWHVQAEQVGLDLKDGKEYVLTFKAKAEADRPITVGASINQDDWHSIGLQETAELTKEFKEIKYEFKAEQTVAGKNRVGISVGNEKGKVWVKEMTLTEKSDAPAK
jgi:hypothetical protein